MRVPNEDVRDHLVNLLDWQEAHVPLDKAVANLAPAKRGAAAPGFEHSVWQLLEHIRIAHVDILDFLENPKYTHDMKWPDDYWPTSPAPPTDAAWDESIAECARLTKRFQQVAREVEDLTVSVPTGKPHQTYLRGVLLAADHVAYHVGQIVAVRKALGAWG
jgi:uncharacterized damage-inducible protein DinB